MPTYDTWLPEFGLSLIAALQPLPYEFHVSVKRDTYLDRGRDAIMLQALELKSDYLVFLDTDMNFPQDALKQLLSHNKDIIGGAYNEKRLPLTTTVKMWNPERTGFVAGDALPKEPFQCAAVATGFMAINLRRLQQCMAAPWFGYETAERMKLNAELGLVREDVAFCVRAGRCGLQVWCDPTIPLQHIGRWAF